MPSLSIDDERWLSALLRPLRLAGIELPNRLMMSALTLQYGEDGLISDRHLAFYAERARGGVGLMFSEQLAASALDAEPFAHVLRAYDPRQIERFARLAAALAPFGTRFFAQLFSAGAASTSTGGSLRWSPLYAPSAIPAPGSDVPQPLSHEHLQRLIADYVGSAVNVRAGGLHGVELHAAHGWLLGQFLSPYYNRRQDEYGGSIENRCRLTLEIGRAIRVAVGPDFPLGVALTYDELMGDAGITPEDTLEQLSIFDRAGIFDFFDLSIGSSHQQHHTIASMSVAEGFALPFAARAKASVRAETAIFVAGRIVDPYMAGRAVALGQADVVAMSRAHLADPLLLKKARGLDDGKITRCIGANFCVHRALDDQPVTCVVNPATGRELEWKTPPPATTAYNITVIGAGPSGLRFATVAARRGHRVTVVERRAHAGGHLALLARLPTRGAWNLAIQDMVGAAVAAGAELELEREIDTHAVLERSPDTVVLATGSRWIVPDHLRIQARQHKTFSGSHRLLPLDQAIDIATGSQAERLGEHVLIVDASGTYAPLGLADLLTARGVRVTFMTPNEALGHVAFKELELPHVMPRLMQRGMQTLVAKELVRIDDGTAILRSVWGGSESAIPAVDCVVLSVQRASENHLLAPLQRQHSHVLCLGDAVSPRSTAAVIHEGEALARSL